MVLAIDTDINYYHHYYTDIAVDPTTRLACFMHVTQTIAVSSIIYQHSVPVSKQCRWFYWISSRGLERMSMDGNNRTIVINRTHTNSHYDDAILSFVLDYQTQTIYWVSYDLDDDNMIIKCSNVDGTNQQTILHHQMYHYYYYEIFYTPPGLTIHKETLYLSFPWMREVYTLGTNGGKFTTFIDESVLCRVKYQLKVIKQPAGKLNRA